MNRAPCGAMVLQSTAVGDERLNPICISLLATLQSLAGACLVSRGPCGCSTTSHCGPLPSEANGSTPCRACCTCRCSAGERLRALAECQEARSALLALPQPEALAVLRDYMTAATAKDCSVMIALRRLPGGDVTPSDDALGVAAVGSQHFEYKVR